jgi:hypothetical protein
VVAADSGAAVLDDQFNPLFIVATSAVLVEPPYMEASFCLTEPVFSDVERGARFVIDELKLCQKLLRTVKADVVHLDMSLGGLNIEELSPIQLSGMRITTKARKEILGIAPKIRKAGAEIKRIYGIDVLALGKNSVPVRIAELTSGAHAILYASEKAIEEKAKVRLGLPIKCQPKISERGVKLQSLIPAEHDLKGHADDIEKILKKVRIIEMLNPCVRGFRALEITP